MSNELPSQLLLQQHAARPVSGEELETMGKHAAVCFHEGRYGSLNQAVVDTVKCAGLSPEQVRRVVEFTNTHAFLKEFNKTAEPHKYVFFKEGLASPSEVIKDLNDGSGGTVFDPGVSDYAEPPAAIKMSSARAVDRNLDALEKTAGVSFNRRNITDEILEEGFKLSEAQGIPFAHPLADTEDAQQKLASARDAATSELSELEVLFGDIQGSLYQQVKQAAAAGVPLGHIVQAWVQVLEPEQEHVKLAFAYLGPRLVSDGIFSGYEALGDSLEKTANAKFLTNSEHPIVKTFAGFCETFNKMAHLRVARNELFEMEEKVEQFLRLAAEHLEVG